MRDYGTTFFLRRASVSAGNFAKKPHFPFLHSRRASEIIKAEAENLHEVVRMNKITGNLLAELSASDDLTKYLSDNRAEIVSGEICDLIEKIR